MLRVSGIAAAAACAALVLLGSEGCDDGAAKLSATAAKGGKATVTGKASATTPSPFAERDARVSKTRRPDTTPSPGAAAEAENSESDGTEIGSVRIEADVDSGGAPLAVNFTAEVGESVPGAHFVWDFGDNSARATGRRVEHTFWHPGEYNVSVTARAGDEATDEVTITVEEEGFDLDIEADPDIGTAPLSVKFGAVLDEDLPGPFRYQWEFGDGGRDVSPQTSHTYRTPGEYVAVLTVSNAQGQWAQRDVHIQVDEPESD